MGDVKIPKGWKYESLSDIADIRVSNVDKKSKPAERDVFLCNYLDVYKNSYITKKMRFMKATATDAEILKFSINLGDVLITKDSEEPTDIAVSSVVVEQMNEVVCGYHLAIIRPNTERINSNYLMSLFRNNLIKSIVRKKANGLSRYSLSIKTLKELPIILPPLDEQVKIAEILTNVDENIESADRLLNICQRVRSGLIFSLISVQMRQNPDWKYKKFHEIFASVRRSIVKDATKSYKRVIIQRGMGGVVLRDQIAGSQIKVNSQFLVKKGDFVISKRQVFHGAVGIAPEDLENSLISNEYEAMVCKSGYNTKFLFYCSHTQEFRDTIVKRTQGVDKEKFRFLFENWMRTMGLKVPELVTQNSIAEIFGGIDDRIQKEELNLERLRKMKTALMQKLLSGELRVRVD